MKNKIILGAFGIALSVGAAGAAPDFNAVVSAVNASDGDVITFVINDEFNTDTCNTQKSQAGYDQKPNANGNGCEEKTMTLKVEKYGSMAADYSANCKIKDGKIDANSCQPPFTMPDPATGRTITGIEKKQ